MQVKPMADQQVAVLIDFENVGLSPIQWLFDQISDVGRIIIKRAYADWSVARNLRDGLLELGIEPIHLFHSAGSGKNSSDIRLAIDAVELLHQSPVDTFVIVSSDSDFVPLVSKLRAAGKTVIGAGRKATVSNTLVRSCDRYFFLDQSEPSSAKTLSPQKQDQDDVLIRAVKAALDEQGKVVGSKLRQTLQRLDPSFDFRARGYSTFVRFLEASPEVKVTRHGPREDVTVELADISAVQKDKPSDPQLWGTSIDVAWSQRAEKSGQPTIPGPTASALAAKVLGVGKLSDSPYKTLQRLLDASDLLGSKWSRDKNTIAKR
ncbi:MAG: NYN domain-containing protein [Chloroflexi bacterium]|nr:NYN domain-containing protein [Chloroflexota bacterium]